MLPDVEEGLDAQGLKVRTFETSVNIVDDAEEPRLIGWTQDEFSFDLATSGCLVRFAKFGIFLQLQASDFLDGDFILVIHLPNLVEFDAHIDLWQFSIGFIVEIAQPHPPAD